MLIGIRIHDKGAIKIFFSKIKPKTIGISNTLKEIKNELKRKKKTISKQIMKEMHLTYEDTALIQFIKERTIKLNKNNVTRTNAYLEFYLRYPEIHWALLGHMVSRNGGWNMTDLKGDIIANLLSDKEKQDFFSFLERGNWLIFQDVYPQFLLYEESLNRNKNLFYLLPYLNVSIFMETIWNYFWKHRDSYILAIGLVINEQSYLEERVIQNPVYQQTVLGSLEFKLQDILSLNQILFPYYENNLEKNKVKIIGQTLHHFNSLHERILLGKRLYTLIFDNNDMNKNIVSWAITTPHTGSRKDYWPHLFHDTRQSVPGLTYKRRIKNCQLQKGAYRIYSPRLTNAWKDVNHYDAELGDWYHDWRVIEYLRDKCNQINGEITDEYCETLEKIELAILAKKVIFR